MIGILLLLVVLPGFELSLRFTNDARDSGLTVPNTFGGRLKKDYILETTGNGVAIFDYDGDGSNDILITNGTVIDRPPSHSPAFPHLYRNDGTGHFTERAREAGLTQEGWGQGVCVGDYDNDGRPDLLLTYYGHNLLYRNLGNGKFADVTRTAGLR